MTGPFFRSLAHREPGSTYVAADRASMSRRTRVFKYYWWVFWEGSPCEGPSFYANEHRLCTADAFALTARLRAEGKPHIIVKCLKVPRLDPAHSPLHPGMKTWKNSEWAPAWDDDPDPEWKGHK